MQTINYNIPNTSKTYPSNHPSKTPSDFSANTINQAAESVLKAEEKEKPKRVIKTRKFFEKKEKTPVTKANAIRTYNLAIRQFVKDPESTFDNFKEITRSSEHLLDNRKMGNVWLKLGRLYQNGLGTDPNPIEAEKAYIQAFKCGFIIAEYFIGTLYENQNNLKVAQRSYHRHLKAGGWQSHYKLGLIELKKGQIASALKHFEQCLIKSKSNKAEAKEFEFEISDSQKMMALCQAQPSAKKKMALTFNTNEAIVYMSDETEEEF